MDDRYKSTKKVSVLGIAGNLFLLIIKASIGIITGSQAMIADSVNSAGDIFVALMTYIGNKIASKPKDDSHNLGHGKAEYIFSLFIGMSMIAVSLELLFSSVSSIFNGESYSFSWALVVACIITIITKLSLYIYTSKLSKKYNNVLIKANANDHRNDCFVTTFTLISVLLSAENILYVDGIVGAGISIWICITGIKIFIESCDVLVDKSIDEEGKKKVLEIIEKYPEIKKIQHFNSTPVGYKYQISFTIFVDGNLSTFESHEIADKIEREIESKLDEIYLTVIHVNPI